MKNNRKFSEDWKKNREKRWETALYFGLIYGVITSGVIGLFYLSEKPISEIYWSQDAFIRVFIFIVLGYCISAFWLWRMNEERYKRIEKSKEK